MLKPAGAGTEVDDGTDLILVQHFDEELRRLFPDQ